MIPLARKQKQPDVVESARRFSHNNHLLHVPSKGREHRSGSAPEVEAVKLPERGSKLDEDIVCIS